MSRLKSYKVFILASGNFVAPAEGERYNLTSRNDNLEREKLSFFTREVPRK